jgi:hypothetical protein
VEALCALEIYEKIGAAKNVGVCSELLQVIEWAMENQGEFFETPLIPRHVNSIL